jgi:FkbM family methyltransferase
MKHATNRPDLIFDVGMHQGEDTDFYLKKGFRVVAFEANPELAEYCRNRFANALERDRLTIVEGAIVDPAAAPSGTVAFYKNLQLPIWGTVCADWVERNDSLGTSSVRIEVPVVDFSQALLRYGMPHYLKIDIEGMDVVCLKALTEFDSQPDFISIESNKVEFSRVEEEFRILTSLGYDSFQAVQQATIPRQKEPQPAAEGQFAGYRFEEGASGLFGRDLPGCWKTYEKILQEYRRIFLLYSLFGDRGRLTRSLPGRVLRRLIQTLAGRQFPGWFDTHAMHSSMKEVRPAEPGIVSSTTQS